VKANFSSNVVTDDPALAELQAYLQARTGCITSYPEACAESLTQVVAETEQVPPGNVLVTSGATAAIHLLAQAHRRRRSTVVVPTFSEYEDACRIHQHRLTFARRGEEGDSPAADLLWFCNPNNPTGEMTPREELLELVDRNPQRIHVVDTAYETFTTTPGPRAADVVSRRNLVLVKSMTKAFSIPGLRLGYVVAPAGQIAELRSHAMPWAVNSLAIEAGRFLLRRGMALTEERRRGLLARRAALQGALGALPGLSVYPSGTHYFLFALDEPRSAELKAWLLGEHGLLVRDASNFHGLDGRHVRVAALDEASNALLAAALAAWIGRVEAAP
jgi:threonine-phosphate decarboxylase